MSGLVESNGTDVDTHVNVHPKDCRDQRKGNEEERQLGQFRYCFRLQDGSLALDNAHG